MSGLTVEEYVQKCKTFDNEDFFVARRDCKTSSVLNVSGNHQTFVNTLVASGALAEGQVHKVKRIKKIHLCGRGRGNRVIQTFSAKNQSGCWVFKFGRQAPNGLSASIVLQRVDDILGVEIAGKMVHIAFFGPQWRARRVKDLFEVYETNAVLDRLGKGSMKLHDVAFPCKVRHRHRFEGTEDDGAWVRMTERSCRLEAAQSCRFDMTCEKKDHAPEKENFCRECMQDVIRGGDKPKGSKEYVAVDQHPQCKEHS